MPTGEIAELQQVFPSRLDTLSHLLSIWSPFCLGSVDPDALIGGG